MKKFLSLIISSAIILCLLASCSNDKTLTDSNANADNSSASNQYDSFKKAYYDVLVNENGDLNYEYTEFEIEGFTQYTGALFTELFDWNTDGVPELMIGYSSEANFTYNIDYLDVYTFVDGQAKLIMTTDVYPSYGALDGSQTITFNRGQDGILYLGVFNEETNEMSAFGETLFDFKDGKVIPKRFYYANEGGYELPDKFVDFQIDGNYVTEEEFYEIKNKYYTDDRFSLFVNFIEQDILIDYLAGETDSYTNQLFAEQAVLDEIPSWVNEADFGVNKTFN